MEVAIAVTVDYVLGTFSVGDIRRGIARGGWGTEVTRQNEPPPLSKPVFINVIDEGVPWPEACSARREVNPAHDAPNVLMDSRMPFSEL
jgi:hypothetical protein